MGVVRPSLSLVDVSEQEQCLRFDFGTAELGGLLRDLEQLVRGFLELAKFIAMSARCTRSSTRRSACSSSSRSRARV